MSEGLWLPVTATAGLVVGGIIGAWAARRRAERIRRAADWEGRLAARDRDLAEAVDRMLEADLALHDAIEARRGGPGVDPEAEARIGVLTEELAEAEDELTRLRALAIDHVPDEGSVADRMERLEAELVTLESFRCPDPSAHRPRPVEPQPQPAPQPVGDDLTRITGVGPGLASVLRHLGYDRFEDVARLTDDDLSSIAELTGGVAGPAAREGWVLSAKRLAEERAAVHAD